MEFYLIFQSGNEMATTRFRNYLSRHGWQRLSRGVYQSFQDSSFDEQAFWNEVKDEFSFNPDRDFFAIFRSERPFVGTNRYYNKQAPPWPIEPIEPL